ncbi:MAG: carbon-nitrogen hydrolase family protein [Thermoplasmata archaeon]|nr:carbon-nitrogen hydrolase family protein [Thermoplasmata archaeon]
MSKFKAVLAQLSPKLRDKDENLEKMRDVVRNHKVDLYVFGELFLTGYACGKDFGELAETIDGNSVSVVTRLARENDSTIIFGMPELEKETGDIYNSCVVATPDGNVQSYRKIHLPHFGLFTEKHYFRSGQDVKLFETPVGKIGCMICYDIFFPEMSKRYALDGADLLVCISAGPTVSSEFFEKVVPARAVETTTFVLFCNLVGKEADMECYGGSTVMFPRGGLMAKCRHLKEEVLEVVIDLGDLEPARRSRPTLKDTRLDIMNELKGLENRAHKC